MSHVNLIDIGDPFDEMWEQHQKEEKDIDDDDYLDDDDE